jgi:sulfotransferase family protein
MPIIMGAPRSGTTLLRFMIDAHPDIAIPPETAFLRLGAQFTGAGDELRHRFVETITAFPTWPDFGIPKETFRQVIQRIEPFSASDGYRAFYRTYAERFGKPRWGDKTPMSCLHLDTIKVVLPEAHFIHLIRDGRDVALSWRQTWFSPGPSMEVQADEWARCVSTARAQGAGCPHYLEVRFEDLIRNPASVLAEICRFVELPYTEQMLDYYVGVPARLAELRSRVNPDGTVIVSHATRLRQQALTMEPPQRSRIQSWKRTMDPEERARFERAAGDLLQELGYEV